MTVLFDINQIKSYEHATTSLRVSLYKSINSFVDKIYHEARLQYDSKQTEADIRKWIEELEYKGESSFSVDHGYIRLGWHKEEGIQPICYLEYHITREEYFNIYNCLQEPKKHDTIPNSLDLLRSMHNDRIGS